MMNSDFVFASYKKWRIGNNTTVQKYENVFIVLPGILYTAMEIQC